MNIELIASRQCNHRPNLERELQDLGFNYQVIFVEDDPEVCQRYGIRHSPCLVVDGKLLSRDQPTEGELKILLGNLS